MKIGAQAEIVIGDVHTEAEEFQEAVNAYARAETKMKEIGTDVLDQARSKLKQANVLLEQSKKKQYYKVRRGAEGRGHKQKKNTRSHTRPPPPPLLYSVSSIRES